MPGVTISAPYGAGGSQVAPAVAATLGMQFLDRAISVQLARQLDLPVEEVLEGGAPQARLDRVLGFFATVLPEMNTGEAVPDTAEKVRDAARAVMVEALETSPGAVVLGRAGALALARVPGVLHVRLRGATADRIRQGAVINGWDEAESARRQPEVDHARETYIRRLYDCDADDPALYQLELDSTRLPLPVCVDVIVAAYRGMTAA